MPWIHLDPLAHHELHLGAGLLMGNTVGQSPDGQQIMRAHRPRVGGVQPQRGPHLDAVVVDIETRRHHADDHALDPVDLDRVSHQLLTRRERALPQLVGENRRRLAAGKIFLRRERPSEVGLGAQGLEEARRAGPRRNTDRRLATGDAHLTHVVGADALERGVGILKLQVFRRREPELVESQRRKRAGDEHQPIRVTVLERLQHDPVDDAEYGAVGADPERQRQDGDGGESRRLPEITEGVAQVLRERLHGRLPYVATGELRGRTASLAQVLTI